MNVNEKIFKLKITSIYGGQVRCGCRIRNGTGLMCSHTGHRGRLPPS